MIVIAVASFVSHRFLEQMLKGVFEARDGELERERNVGYRGKSDLLFVIVSFHSCRPSYFMMYVDSFISVKLLRLYSIHFFKCLYEISSEGRRAKTERA